MKEPDGARTENPDGETDADRAIMADLRLRLQGSQEQERAARAEARRLGRELALARRLLKSAFGNPLDARAAKAAGAAEIPRLRAARITERVAFHFDVCQNRGAHTALSGWAFRPALDWDARATKVTLLFRHGDAIHAAAAVRVPRADVAAHFAMQPAEAFGGAKGLDSAGFACEILNDSLPAGVDLEIALRLEYAGMACEQSTGLRLHL